MPTMRTRAAKGSNLTPTEADSNFKQTVRQFTSSTTVTIANNREVLEANHATVTVVFTLPDATTVLASEPGDWSCTFTNIGAADATVSRAGSDTINGSSSSLTIPQYGAVKLIVNSAGDGFNVVGQISGLISATTFSGAGTNLTGTAASLTAGTAGTVTLASSSSSTTYPVFSTGQTGSQALYTDADVTFNASSGLLTVKDLTVSTGNADIAGTTTFGDTGEKAQLSSGVLGTSLIRQSGTTSTPLTISNQASNGDVNIQVSEGGSIRTLLNADGLGATVALYQSTTQRLITSTTGVTVTGKIQNALTTPASASATGTAGQICWDANYIYICTATDTWKRAGISTW